MTTQTICPNCGTPLMQGSRQCRNCKMDVSKMDAFAAAKKAAEAKGMGGTVVQGVPMWRKLVRPVVVVPAILLLVLIWWFTRPGAPPAWTKFPTTPTEAAKALMDRVAVDTDASFDKGYALIPESARNKELDDEHGLYIQLFRTMNHYLSSEFGSDWMTRVTYAPDPGAPDTIQVRIDSETLHVRTTLATPPEVLNDTNRHYGIAGINEFDVNDAAGFQRMAGVTGFLRAEAGEGAVKNLQSVLASGGHLRETPMQTKLRLLPVLRDPRMVNGNRYAVIQTWKVRQDPVIRHRLEQMDKDERYDADIRKSAENVLHDAVPDEELIAAGVGN